MKRPTSKTTHIKNPGERVLLVSNGEMNASTHQGGLISLRNVEPGELRIDIYRADPRVTVTVSDSGDNAYLSTLQDICRVMLDLRNSSPGAPTGREYRDAIGMWLSAGPRSS